MRILFISESLLTGDLAYRLYCEGHEVKLYIEDDSCMQCYDRLVERTTSWRKEISWVGKEGLIIFDDFGYTKDQEKLREKGYVVCGTSGAAEKTELERSFGDKIFRSHGLQTVPLVSFKNADDAIQFITENPDKWVLKYQNDHWSKPYAYVGQVQDGSDVISLLENYKRLKVKNKETVTLQQRIDGVEIGVGRYFNGEEWVGPIEYNLEHTHLFPGGKGPIVNEMGTLIWFDDNEDEKLYQSTLKRLEPFLRESNFKGDFDINCIINEEGAFPLESTARFGAPAIHAQAALIKSPLTDFFYAVAAGHQADVDWSRDYCVVTSVVTPPFPYRDGNIGKALIGLPVTMSKNMTPEELKHLHLDEIASTDGTLNTLYISGTNGYAFYATGLGQTVHEARERSLDVIRKVNVARMFYREDIGADFEQGQEEKLRSWGYLT